MAMGKKMVVLAGLGLAALFGLNQGAGWAGIPGEGAPHSGETAITEVCDQMPVILARGGNRGGGGSGGNGWGESANSRNRRGYGGQDGTGSAPRPQDGTGYGAGKGTGCGDCDGNGPKGKGRGNRTN